jgi:hypothetical protein
MKKLAIGINLTFAALVLFAYGARVVSRAENDRNTHQMLGEGASEFDEPFAWKDFGLLLAFISLPAVNLICILGNSNSGNGWLSLYVQRRAAEERARIRKLVAE